MPRLNYSKRKRMKEALEMQASYANCVKVLEADLLASTEKDERARLATAMGGLGRTWAGLQDAIRILKGDPLPGSLKPAAKAKRGTSKSSALCALASDSSEMNAPNLLGEVSTI